MELSTGTKKLFQFILDDWKLLLILTIMFALYFYFTSNSDYFEKRGIKFKKPLNLFGNFRARLFGLKSIHECYNDIYNFGKGSPYVGAFEGRGPVLYIIDPDLIKAITIRDFDHFTDRHSIQSREPRFISRSILNLKGADWKAVRSSVTPAFSSSRLKHMLPLLDTCSQQMVEFLKQFDKKDIEIKDIMGHYSLEVIGASAFGIRTNALKDENASFVKIAGDFNKISLLKKFFFFFLLVIMPGALKYINLSFWNYETVTILKNILQTAKAERRNSTNRYNDFLQLLIDTSEKEKEQMLKVKTKDNDTKDGICLDDDTIDAQCVLFLIAGFETTSTTLAFAIHMLAVRPDIQDKLREHVLKVTEGKEMSNELLTQLDYLEAFLLETLRLYSPIPRIDRVVTKPYTLPGTSVTLNVGERVAIPAHPIHMDPDIYPEPEVFRPERFMKEEKNERPSHMFLAFGAGPRNCIGLRFGMNTMKIGMVALLKNFKFSTCAKTQHPIRFAKRVFLLKAEAGLYVRVDKI